jgi:hypothetical protein
VGGLTQFGTDLGPVKVPKGLMMEDNTFFKNGSPVGTVTIYLLMVVGIIGYFMIVVF